MASQKEKHCINPKQRTLIGASGNIGLTDAPNYIDTNNNSIIDDTEKDKSVNKVVQNWYFNKYYNSHFPNLINLACLALTCSVHQNSRSRKIVRESRINEIKHVQTDKPLRENHAQKSPKKTL